MSWAPTLMIERCRQFVVAGIICILALVAPAQTRPAAPAEKPAVSVHLISLHTSDSVRLDGVLYQPLKPTPVGLMLVHGYGGTFYGAYFRQLGQATAEQGMTTLALNMRDHDTGPKASDFADNQTDIAA